MSTRHEAGRLPPVYEAVISAYATALAGSTLANSSRVAYLRRVRGFLTWVAAQDSGSPTSGPPTDVAAAARAAHRYSRHLRHARYATTTIGSVIAAIEDFYARCGLGATGLRRGRDQLAPRL
ncbi:hypothetical protein [Nonomuraea guangzhouensis]|uniref:Core-binding (CB) domain-containing protein n=1 Tax=Nonomuraea guangzhouensis TaxID=1291555 RepID=A0ABW4H012_9ACTN|nr:hypothetical protein [Nonomuraea guangzhouensis]